MELHTIKEDDMEPDTILCYIKNFFNHDETDKLLNLFLNDKFFDSGNRSQKWFQKDGKYFCEQWKNRYVKWHSNNYTKELENLQIKIINELQNYELKSIKIPKINSCLINKYNNGNEHIGPHRDTPLSFGRYPTIINFSIGATREFLFKNIKTKKEYRFNLESGSLFIMAGSSQLNYTHEITKDSSITKPRISFTLREFI